MTRQRHKGDRYRPVVTILKLKNGTIPTVIQVSGRTYILRHEDTRPSRRQTAGNGPYSPDDVREGKTTDLGVDGSQNRNMEPRE